MTASTKVTCPVCNRANVHLRLDGLLGTHFIDSRKEHRRRCPGGLQRHRAMPAGRRVTVTVDLVLPASEWDIRRARASIIAAVRDHCPDLFPVGIDVESEELS